MTPHRQLLAEYADRGSQEAFRELVTLYMGMVYATAVRLVNGDRHRAEDIAQTVFADLARHARTVSSEATIGGWLHRRTCHVAANLIRSDTRRQNREREAVEMSALHENDDEALARVAPVLDEAINELNPQDRHAIMLRFFERCDLRTVGRALGSNEDAAQKRVTRALEKLRVLLVRRGVGLSATTLLLALGSQSLTAAPAGLALTVSSGALAAAHLGNGFSLTTIKLLIMSKIKATVVAAILIAGVGTTMLAIKQDKGFDPGPSPDPQKILREAQADTRAGRYSDALSKHIWFHDNALKFQPSLTGVRRSFALSYWKQLSQEYPPAAEKFKEYQEQSAALARNNSLDQQQRREAFADFAAISRTINREQETVDLFRAFDSNEPDFARTVFDHAEEALVNNNAMELAGRYINPERSYARTLSVYQTLRNTSAGDDRLQAIGREAFTSKVAKLVAVLAVNNRSAEAERIAAAALRELNTPDFAAQLNRAKQGLLPEPQP
ncbi:MAG: RNA polymerase sigma factor [Limisphaerales bacterium]